MLKLLKWYFNSYFIQNSSDLVCQRLFQQPKSGAFTKHQLAHLRVQRQVFAGVVYFNLSISYILQLEDPYRYRTIGHLKTLLKWRVEISFEHLYTFFPIDPHLSAFPTRLMAAGRNISPYGGANFPQEMSNWVSIDASWKCVVSPFAFDVSLRSLKSSNHKK